MTGGDTSEQAPIHLPWEVYRRQITWDQPGGDRWGFHRGRSPELAIEGLTAWTTLLPLGQGSPPITAPADTVLVGGQGELEVTVEQSSHLVGPRDVLHIAGGAGYSYKNVSFETVVLFEAVGEPESGPPLDTHAVCQPWSESRGAFRWDLPMASEWGNHRSVGPHVSSGQVRGHLVQMPPFQGCPWHSSPRESVFFQLDGAVEFHTANAVWPLARFDLFVTRRAPYIYTNSGFEPALFFDLVGLPPITGSYRYFESDPGFPTRDDAVELEMVVDPSGEKRMVRKGA
jgi:quercetin dioxygenase-like cupin family protein